MQEHDVIENFHGVYLLYCMNPKFKGRVYIGYTVNPNRRITQHNKGSCFGGARKTSSKGPWEMVLTVHGFSSDTAALRFEWAWQHYKRSRRLRSVVPLKTRKETSYDFALRIMWTMLRTAPWCRLPLTIRWLYPDLVKESPPNLVPPAHMPIVHGPLKVCKPLSAVDVTMVNKQCSLCSIPIKELPDMVTCVNPECIASYHILCLSEHMLKNEEEMLLPVEGNCTSCGISFLWGDLVHNL